MGSMAVLFSLHCTEILLYTCFFPPIHCTDILLMHAFFPMQCTKILLIHAFFHTLHWDSPWYMLFFHALHWDSSLYMLFSPIHCSEIFLIHAFFHAMHWDSPWYMLLPCTAKRISLCDFRKKAKALMVTYICSKSDHTTNISIGSYSHTTERTRTTHHNHSWFSTTWGFCTRNVHKTAYLVPLWFVSVVLSVKAWRKGTAATPSCRFRRLTNEYPRPPVNFVTKKYNRKREKH